MRDLTVEQYPTWKDPHAHPTATGHCMQQPWNQPRMQLPTMIIIALIIVQ